MFLFVVSDTYSETILKCYIYIHSEGNFVLSEASTDEASTE